MVIKTDVLDVIVCPLCKGPLYLDKTETGEKKALVCPNDLLSFPIRNNIPVMLEDQATTISLEICDAVKKTHHHSR